MTGAWNESYAHILKSEGIAWYGVLPLSHCRITLPRLLPADMGNGTPSVIVFLVPYYTGPGENLSAYAVSKDYHLYMRELFARIIPLLQEAYPGHSFTGFADHSPLDERHAALRCGLGVLGNNGLLIHRDYGSYVFIGQLITTVSPELLGYSSNCNVKRCLQCGNCTQACPGGFLTDRQAPCLSALTQKKGTFSREETALIKANGSVWGCDVCQSVCPMNAHVKHTPLPFFHSAKLPLLDQETITHMTQEEFRDRAYAWRGKATVLRNIEIISKKDVT